MRIEAILMAIIANISRPLAKSVMRTAWIHGGALRAPPCIEGEVMGDFAMGCELFAIFPMKGTWLHAKTTQHNAMSILVAATNTRKFQVTQHTHVDMGAAPASLF